MPISTAFHQVPITITLAMRATATGVDMDDRRYFQEIERHQCLPTTAAPSPSAFSLAYETACGCVRVSSKISAAYNAALAACEKVSWRKIQVVEKSQPSMGRVLWRWLPRTPRRWDISFDVVAQAMETGRQGILYAVLATLKYLAISSRVGKLVAGMADTFNINS